MHVRLGERGACHPKYALCRSLMRKLVRTVLGKENPVLGNVKTRLSQSALRQLLHESMLSVFLPILAASVDQILVFHYGYLVIKDPRLRA